MLIHVVGGSGGVGASVFATALGLAAVRHGQSAVLVDLDPFGGGIDFVLAAEQQPGLRWSELNPTGDPLDPEGLIAALPAVRGMPVLAQSDSLGLLSEAGLGSVTDALRQRVELVVVDIPLWLAASFDPEDQQLVLVAGATCRGVRAAQLAARALDGRGHDVPGAYVMVARDSARAMSCTRVVDTLGLREGGSWVRDERLAMAIECGDVRALETSTKDGVVAAAERLLGQLR